MAFTIPQLKFWIKRRMQEINKENDRIRNTEDERFVSNEGYLDALEDILKVIK